MADSVEQSQGEYPPGTEGLSHVKMRNSSSRLDYEAAGDHIRKNEAYLKEHASAIMRRARGEDTH